MPVLGGETPNAKPAPVNAGPNISGTTPIDTDGTLTPDLGYVTFDHAESLYAKTPSLSMSPSAGNISRSGSDEGSNNSYGKTPTTGIGKISGYSRSPARLLPGRRSTKKLSKIQARATAEAFAGLGAEVIEALENIAVHTHSLECEHSENTESDSHSHSHSGNENDSESGSDGDTGSGGDDDVVVDVDSSDSVDAVPLRVAEKATSDSDSDGSSTTSSEMSSSSDHSSSTE
jgi:hypothetical protein